MKRFFYNITTGDPKKLIAPCVSSFFDGLCHIIPACLLFLVFNTVYKYFVNPSEPMNMRILWTIVIGLVVWIFVQYVVYSIVYVKTYVASYEVSGEGRVALAERLRILPLGYLDGRDPGDLTTMMLGDYANVETTISHHVPQLVSAVALPVVAFIGFLAIDWRMSLAMFIALPVSMLIIYASANLQRKLGINHVKAKIDSASRLQEYLNGMKEIKAHNLSGERFERLREAFARLKKESIKLEGILGPVVMLAVAFLRSGLTIMIFVGAYLLAGGEINLPIFLAFLLVGSKLFEPLTVVMMNLAEIRYTTLSGERIVDVLKEKPLDGKDKAPDGGDIVFDNVTFSYEEKKVIKDLTVKMPQNSMTALVGPSGSGKSTITKLIARFYDVDSGNITIGGKSIKNMDPEELLKKISIVFQDVYLFKDTIRNNIKVGDNNASQEQIEWAAKKANCHEFVSKLPDGYDTVIGEGGSTLSGGEKQRISIARALLKDAPIVLLDEATASLDPENETQVQNAINALIDNKTVIIIAHRLKTIKKADNIIVLDEGKLEEEGTHKRLLSEEGLYSRLWNLQQESAGWVMTV